FATASAWRIRSSLIILGGSALRQRLRDLLQDVEPLAVLLRLYSEVGQIREVVGEPLQALLLLGRPPRLLLQPLIIPAPLLHPQGVHGREPEDGAHQELMQHQLARGAFVAMEHGGLALSVAPQEEELPLAGLMRRQWRVSGRQDLEIRQLVVEEGLELALP